MSTDSNKASVRRIVDEVWNKGNLAVADELIAEDFVNHTPGPDDTPGREGFKQGVIRVRQAFPDFQITIDDMLSEGDKVMIRWTARGTHQGEFRGVPATQRSIAVSGVTIIRHVNGLDAEAWQYSDDVGLLRQLGVLG